MNTKQFLAGIACDILHRLQCATRAKCGGFRLYNRLWQVYTNKYTIMRSGYVMYDLKKSRAQ